MDPVDGDSPPITSTIRIISFGAPARVWSWIQERGTARIVGPIATLGFFITLWYLFSGVFMAPQRRFLVPPPHEVWSVSVIDADKRAELLDGLWVTTQVSLAGLFIAIVVGVTVATIMVTASWIEVSLYPYAVLLQVIPILAIVPLLGLLFGFDFRSRVIVAIMICLFPIITNTLFGLKSADSAMHDLFSLQEASRATRFWKLQLPAALPAMFTGFRIAAGASIIGSIVGDFFFRQGEPGLGILLDRYRAQLRTPELYGAIFYSAILGIAFFSAFGWLAKRTTGRWATTQAT